MYNFIAGQRSITNSKFTKQPSEKFPVSVDFTQLLETDEIIVTSTVTAWNGDVEATPIIDNVIIEATPTSDATPITNENKIVRVIVKDGTSGITYKLTFQITTSDDNIYEEDVRMIVQDK